MKQTATALALGVLIGMGIGPALAGAYSTDPPQDSTRALITLSDGGTARPYTESLLAIDDAGGALKAGVYKGSGLGDTLYVAKPTEGPHGESLSVVSVY